VKEPSCGWIGNGTILEIESNQELLDKIEHSHPRSIGAPQISRDLVSPAALRSFSEPVDVMGTKLKTQQGQIKALEAHVKRLDDQLKKKADK